MKNTWFNGIVAVCFLALSYLFEMSGAHISGVIFLILAIAFAVQGFAHSG